MKVHLYIEQLVLEGIPAPPGDSYDLQSSIQSELTKLISAHCVAARLPANAPVSDLFGDTLRLNPQITAHQLGIDVGRATYSAFGRTDAGTTGGPEHE